MILNIITRTRGRPKFFKLCYETIHNCKFNNLTLNHWVIYDDDSTLEYLKGYENIKLFKATKKITSAQHLGHNDYFNQIYKVIKSGVLFHLDDDDFISHPEAFLAIEDEICSIKLKELLIVKFRLGLPGMVIPDSTNYREEKIVKGRIGGSAIICSIEMAKLSNWPSIRCGDYCFIEGLSRQSKNIKWITHQIASAHDPGLGLFNDLTDPNWLKHPDIENHWKDKINLPNL